MRTIFCTALLLAGLSGGTAALADDFSGGPPSNAAAASAALDRQATASQFADPTAPDSLRSHGHP